MPVALDPPLFHRATERSPFPPPGHASSAISARACVVAARAVFALLTACVVIIGISAAMSPAPPTDSAQLLPTSSSVHSVAADAAAVAERCLGGDVRLLVAAATEACASAAGALLAPMHRFAFGPLRAAVSLLGKAPGATPLADGALLLAGGDCGETAPPVETGWHPRSPAVLAYLGSVGDAEIELRRMFAKHRAINMAAVTSSKIVSCNPYSKTCTASDVSAADVCEKAFPDKTKNLRRSEVVFSMFEEEPHCIPSKVPGQFKGADISMVDTFTKNINAVPKIIITKGNYGERLSNGTFTGSSGDLVAGRAEFACNSRSIKMDRIHAIEFLYPHHQSDMFIFVPNSLPLPAYTTILVALEPLTWAAVGCSLPLAALLWHALRRARPGGEGGPGGGGGGGAGREARRSAQHTFLDTLKVLLGDGLDWEPSGRRERTFYTSWLWFTLLIRTLFLGSFSSHLTITHYGQPINSIQEWYDSGMGLAVFASLFNMTVEYESAGRTFTINERMVLRRRDYTHTMITHRNLSSMTRFNRIEYAMRLREHVAADGRPLLHIVPERLVMTHVRYEAALHSPLVPRFNRVVLSVQQAGLFTKWYRDVLDAGVAQGTLVPLASATERPPSPLVLEHLQAAQLLLGAGLVFAVSAFAAELAAARLLPRAARRRKRRTRHLSELCSE